jgi:uncharacterized membrane protein YkoI
LNSTPTPSGRRIPAVLLAFATAVMFAWLVLSGDCGIAGEMRDPQKQRNTSAAAKVSEEQAKQIALKTMPGDVTSVVIEKKRGRNVYVVEIQTPRGEKDVLVDIQTGDVVGTE